MSPNLILAYLYHDRASQASEQLLALEVASLPFAKPADQRRELERLRRTADGQDPQTPTEYAAQRKAFWDAQWARLRAHLGSAGSTRGGLRPGERFVNPAE